MKKIWWCRRWNCSGTK